MQTRVILLGKGTLAIRIADWFRANPDFDLVQIVPVVPEPTWTDSLIEWAVEHSVPYVASGRYQDIGSVREPDWSVDLAFSVFYDRIIQPWFIDKCHTILNLHNSPLPKYRGVSPINWALKNGEDRHGVTIHEITPGIDDGPIVSQVEFSMYHELDEVQDVLDRALAFGWTLFQQTMPIVDRITPRPQDESEATFYDSTANTLLGDRRSFTREQSLRSQTVASSRHG